MIAGSMLRLVELVKYKILKNTRIKCYEAKARHIPLMVYGSEVPPKAEKQETKDLRCKTRKRERKKDRQKTEQGKEK
jgi:hypothetical protein